MYLISGLGNPGKEYELTRHNIGFLAVEEVAKNLGVKELRSKSKMQALIAESEYEGKKIILAQPTTFMNNSGIAVSSIANWHKIPIERVIVIHDDADLEPGKIRVRQGGGAGGHHGIESILAHAVSADFIRVRIGIGRESVSGDISNYVLSGFRPEERETMAKAVIAAAEAALAVVAMGLGPAMNQFNA